ncbi:MAG: ABC transporter ATP-binding protein [Anaerolineae bacterium]|nr:ABC transporter ATP-binding protein [Anaerolineae bacterium]
MNDIKVELIDVVKEFPIQRGETTRFRAVNNLNLDIYDGEFFALLGPSGCGKTTTLRLIAGFEQPSSGQILIDGKPMQGIPSFSRPVNTVFQDYALFPHMSVLQNVMFGLQMDKVPRKEAEGRAVEALEMVRLPNALNRKPKELSGGQQQRVALARAIVKRPKVLLLDEPLGALDLKLRREMQFELKSMQQELGITFIFVTHDQEEALTMANRIGVMHDGNLLQVGRPEEIYETPATRFVADFIGETNFIDGKLVSHTAHEGVVSIDDETTVTAMIGADQVANGQAVSVAVRPEKMTITAYSDTPPSTEHNIVHGQVAQVFYIGTDTRYAVRVGKSALVNVRVQNTAAHHTTFKERDTVTLSWERSVARILTH